MLPRPTSDFFVFFFFVILFCFVVVFWGLSKVWRLPVTIRNSFPRVHTFLPFGFVGQWAMGEPRNCRAAAAFILSYRILALGFGLGLLGDDG